MEADLGRKLRVLKVDGGAVQSEPLMQFQADVLGLRVVRPQVISTTALGAALLAGLSVGLFSSPTAIRKVWQEEREFRRAMSRRQIDDHIASWRKAIARTRL